MDRSEVASELERLHADCWGWALACVGRDADLARDVLQTSYAKVLSGAARWDRRSIFRTWVFGVVRISALEELRRRRGNVRLEPDHAARLVADTAPGPDIVAEQSERAAVLLSALSTLSTQQREVLHLVFYHGMTIEEAARVMNVSIGTARTHYHRGKRALADEVAHLREDVP